MNYQIDRQFSKFPQFDPHRLKIYNPKAEKVFEFFSQSSSITVFALKLFRDAFTLEERTKENVNLNGKRAKGHENNLPQVDGLDRQKLSDIYDIISCFIKNDIKERNLAFVKINKAFNKDLSIIKKK